MRHITPTGVARARACLHSWWLECHGDHSLKDEPDAGTRLTWERGLEWERKVAEKLRADDEVAEPQGFDKANWQPAIQSTIELMRQGKKWIYQAVLRDENAVGTRASVRGRPDLLRRMDSPSKLGSHSYMPVDIKNHKKANTRDRYQLLAYALMLEPILGYRPAQGAIWVNTAESPDDIAPVPLDRDAAKLDEVLGRMAKAQFEKYDEPGLRCSECKYCAWHGLCSQRWEQEESVCLVRSVTGETARKLYAGGLITFRKLSQAGEKTLTLKLGFKEKTAHNIWMHGMAKARGEPVVKEVPQFPEGLPVYFYDVETFGETTYLHGVIRVDGGNREEKFFCARKLEDEAHGWHEFLDYVARDKEAVVWTWTEFENKRVERLWALYGGNEAGWKVLQGGLKDQCKFVKDHFALPVTGYSIKEVAPIFGFHWQAEDAGGLNSEMWYREWLETGDEAIIEKILTYNRDDVLAMEVIDRELKKYSSSDKRHGDGC